VRRCNFFQPFNIFSKSIFDLGSQRLSKQAAVEKTRLKAKGRRHIRKIEMKKQISLA
jgi:hypothetical protein